MEHLSLLELNRIIRDCLDSHLDPSYWVVAEISDLRVNQKGHCYLELVEKQEDEILAKSRATIWSYAYRNLSMWFESATGEPLKAGMKILANVAVNFHEVYGMSLNIRDIDASFTVGERAIRRQQIMKKLVEDGVAEMNKELPLPLVPQRVAVISAPTAAGYQDFTDQLLNNAYHYQFHIQLFPALMQGKEAEDSIITALHAINKKLKDYDLVVLIRGGGGVSDLDCFDGYRVASHVAQFPLPVVTGIGHERDETIVDLVAHTRLKTPTAVAEFLISGLRRFEDSITELSEMIYDEASGILKDETARIDQVTGELKHLSSSVFLTMQNQLELISNRFLSAARHNHERVKSVIDQAVRTLRHMTAIQLSMEGEKMRLLNENLALLEIDATLNRGFTITRIHGNLIRDAGQLTEGERISTQYYRGTTESIIQ